MYRGQSNNIWTFKAANKLRQLWDDGHSASAIAALFGAGMTRNAIIGKARRMRLPRRAATNERKPYPKELGKTVSRPNQIPGRPAITLAGQSDGRFQGYLRIEAPDAKMLAVMQLRAEDCRFPIGDVGSPGFGFCGHEKVRGAYCKYHAELCYRRIIDG